MAFSLCSGQHNDIILFFSLTIPLLMLLYTSFSLFRHGCSGGTGQQCGTGAGLSNVCPCGCEHKHRWLSFRYCLLSFTMRALRFQFLLFQMLWKNPSEYSIVLCPYSCSILSNPLTFIPSLSASTASSLNLPSGPAIVSILVSKNAGRYRIQGDSYPAMLLGKLNLFLLLLYVLCVTVRTHKGCPCFLLPTGYNLPHFTCVASYFHS